MDKETTCCQHSNFDPSLDPSFDVPGPIAQMALRLGVALLFALAPGAGALELTPATWDEKTAKDGAWGGEFELLAAAALWDLQAVIIRPGERTVIIGSGRQLLWLKLAGSHYEALRTPDEDTARQVRRAHIAQVPSYMRLAMRSLKSVTTKSWILQRGGAKRASSTVSSVSARSCRTLGRPLSARSSVSSAMTLKPAMSVKTLSAIQRCTPRRAASTAPSTKSLQTIRSVSKPSVPVQPAATDRMHRYSAESTERATKFRALAKLHWWMHSPVPTPTTKYPWQCAYCKVVLASLGSVRTAAFTCRVLWWEEGDTYHAKPAEADESC